jgi:YhcH/YjgK/YiaL family protein
MAVFGSYGDLSELFRELPLFAEAFEYLRHCFTKGTAEHARLLAMAEGATYRHELRDGVYAMESVYATRARGDCFFESHRRYFDVQALVEGEEAIELLAIDRLRLAAEYVADKDLVKYGDSDFASRLRLVPGELAIFFPPDGHMPCLRVAESRPVVVRKTVVKVPVPPGFTLR